MKGRSTGQPTRCASCGCHVDARRLAALSMEIDRRQRATSLEQKKTLQELVDDLESKNAKDFGKITKSQRTNAAKSRKHIEGMIRRDRILHEQELLQLRNAFATSIAHLKDAYVQQAHAIEELRSVIRDNIESIPSRLESLAETSTSQLREHREWLEQSLPATLLEQLGSALSAAEDSEIERDRLTNEIAKRDSHIEQATERISQLENMLAAKRSRAIWRRVRRETAEPYKDEPQVEPQKEILDIIREIAKERNRMTATDKDKVKEDSFVHFADSFGSRMSARMSH